MTRTLAGRLVPAPQPCAPTGRPSDASAAAMASVATAVRGAQRRGRRFVAAGGEAQRQASEERIRRRR